MKICPDCKNEIFHLRCPCSKLEVLYTEEETGRKLFKKKCAQCDRLINSYGVKGLLPKDVHFTLCGSCEWKDKRQV